MAWLSNSQLQKCSQYLSPRGCLSRDEFQKPEYTTRHCTWSSPLVLFLTQQSEGLVKPLLLCLPWKESCVFQGVDSMSSQHPNLREQKYRWAVRSRNNQNRERQPLLPATRHHSWPLALVPRISQHHCGNILFAFGRHSLLIMSPCTAFPRKCYCHLSPEFLSYMHTWPWGRYKWINMY